MNMPAIDMIIIIGKIRNIGFLAMSRPPTVIISAIIPMTATIITNGISLMSEIARDVPRNLRRRLQIDFATRHARRHHPQAADESLRAQTLLPNSSESMAAGALGIVSADQSLCAGGRLSLTLPPSLSDLDPDSESEQELSRLTLVVGELNLDVGLPANVSIAAYINDVIDIANEQIAVRKPSSDVVFDDSEGKWTLARLGGDPIDPQRSLTEAGIYDGDLLMIREAGRPVSPLLFDDVEDTAAQSEPAVRGWLAREAAALTCFGLGLAASVHTGRVAAALGRGSRGTRRGARARGARRGGRLRGGLPARGRAALVVGCCGGPAAGVRGFALRRARRFRRDVAADGVRADCTELASGAADLGGRPLAAHRGDCRVRVRRCQRDGDAAVGAARCGRSGRCWRRRP